MMNCIVSYSPKVFLQIYVVSLRVTSVGLLYMHALITKTKVHSRWSLLLPYCPFCNCLFLSPLPLASMLSQPPLLPGSSRELSDPSGNPSSDLLQNKIDPENLISYHCKLKGRDTIFTLEALALGRYSVST